jgi:hypothetical protein
MRTRSFLRRGYLLVSMLAVAALIGAIGHGSASVAHDENREVNATIYRSLGAPYFWLQELEPQTLRDLGDRTPSDPSFRPWTVVFSRDGSTMAALAYGGDVVTKRGVTGSEVARFPAGGARPIALNADGSKLLVRIEDSTVDWWSVFDTATGNKLIEIEESTGFGSRGIYQVDPVGWKLYRLGERISIDSKPDGYFPTELVAYDLASGKEIARADLPDVEMGIQAQPTNPELTATSLAYAGYVPGFAISRDGTELAIVHVVGDGITLIDATSLNVTRTLTMHETTNLLGKIFVFIAPQTAEAKFFEGTVRTAFYASDGKRLYVSGYDATTSGEVFGYRGYGLNVVSLEDGAIERTVLEDDAVDRLIETPDGRLIATGVHFSAGNPRLVAGALIATLELQARDVIKERKLYELVSFVVVPGMGS